MWITCTSCRHYYDTTVSGGHYCTVGQKFMLATEHSYTSTDTSKTKAVPEATPEAKPADPLPKALVSMLETLDRSKASKRSHKITLSAFGACVESIGSNGTMDKLLQVVTEVAEDIHDIAAILHHTWGQDMPKRLRPIEWPSFEVTETLQALLREHDPKAVVMAEQPGWSADPVLVVDSTAACPRRFAGYGCVEPTKDGKQYRFCSGFLSTLLAGATTNHE